MERQLKEKQSKISPEKAIDIAKTIYQIEVKIKEYKTQKILLLTDEQKYLAQLFNFG